MSLPEALTNLGERGPEAVRPQFRAFATDYAASARFATSPARRGVGEGRREARVFER